MADTLQECRRKVDRARELGSVVRTMKALSATSVSQFEEARRALADYERTVRLGLHICLRATPVGQMPGNERRERIAGTAAIVFGSDQGLVGQFNESIADFAMSALGDARATVWTVGQRVQVRIAQEALEVAPPLPVPSSVNAITGLVQQLLTRVEDQVAGGRTAEVRLFFHRILSGSEYGPVELRLLPLDARWRRELLEVRWPTANLPEVAGALEPTLAALVREYLFVSLFAATAESLAAENASRLAAMQRAERSIDELLDELTRTFNRLRQGAIDAELFDVVAGFEALAHTR